MLKIAQFLTVLTVSSCLVAGKMNNKQQQMRHGSMSSNVDFQMFDIEGQVHDVMWCGDNDEILLMHTDEGAVYRSRDKGASWKQIHNILGRHASEVVDEEQDVSSHI